MLGVALGHGYRQLLVGTDQAFRDLGLPRMAKRQKTGRVRYKRSPYLFTGKEAFPPLLDP